MFNTIKLIPGNLTQKHNLLSSVGTESPKSDHLLCVKKIYNSWFDIEWTQKIGLKLKAGKVKWLISSRNTDEVYIRPEIGRHKNQSQTGKAGRQARQETLRSHKES